MRGDVRRILLLAAEAAAGGAVDDPYRPRITAGDRSQCVQHVVGTLHRSFDHQHAAGVDMGDHALRLDVHMFLGTGLEATFENDLRRRFARSEVTARHQVIAEDVAGTHLAAQRERIVDREHRRRIGAFVHRHRRQRLAQQATVRMREQQHRLAGMAEPVAGQHRLVLLDHPGGIGARDIGSGNHDERRPVDARTELDALDRATRGARAHRGTVQHAGVHEIVDIACLAKDLGRGILAHDRSAHRAPGFGETVTSGWNGHRRRLPWRVTSRGAGRGPAGSCD